MLVLKASELKPKGHVLTSTSAPRIPMHADMMQFVLTLKEGTSASVLPDITETPTLVYAHRQCADVRPTRSAAPTKSASSQASVFALRRSSSIQVVFAGALASVSLAESMPSAVQLIPHSACAKLASRAIRFKAASALMSAPTHRAPMARNVSIRREAISVFAPRECPATPTKAVAFSRIRLQANQSATQTTNALQICTAVITLASAPALICFAALTLSVNPKTTPAGVAAVSGIKRDRMETAYHVSY